MASIVLFGLASAVTLVSAVATVWSKSPLRSALYLISSLCGVALLFLLLDAPFVGAMQVLVYAGAIMVLFVFVVMLLNLGEGQTRPRTYGLSKILGSLAVFYVSYRVATAAFHMGESLGASKSVDGTVKGVGTLLLSDYLFGFEAISVLLLTAVVGAVVFGMKRLS